MRHVLFLLVVVLVAAVCGRWVLDSRSTFSLEKPSEIGRYQTSVVGSQTRLFAGCFVVDSMSGKTWATTVTNGRAQEWKEIQEEGGKAPPASSEPGRYRIDASYVSDTIGQEAGTTVRVDSVTGDLWLMVLAPPPARWILLPDHQSPPATKK
jgi:hypothetical protein